MAPSDPSGDPSNNEICWKTRRAGSSASCGAGCGNHSASTSYRRHWCLEPNIIKATGWPKAAWFVKTTPIDVVSNLLITNDLATSPRNRADRPASWELIGCEQGKTLPKCSQPLPRSTDSLEDPFWEGASAGAQRGGLRRYPDEAAGTTQSFKRLNGPSRQPERRSMRRPSIGRTLNRPQRNEPAQRRRNARRKRIA